MAHLKRCFRDVFFFYKLADWFLFQKNQVASENEVFDNKMFLKILLCIQSCSVTEACSFVAALSKLSSSLTTKTLGRSQLALQSWTKYLRQL